MCTCVRIADGCSMYLFVCPSLLSASLSVTSTYVLSTEGSNIERNNTHHFPNLHVQHPCCTCIKCIKLLHGLHLRIDRPDQRKYHVQRYICRLVLPLAGHPPSMQLFNSSFCI
ncbi:unnamed protein product [Periconia digitata]|uniref:Uncharacterized protein n=1 Tax=Periconia digitata TaxID=1303443 RepID=A0A9W4U2S0_9PLEO|nr:unnamed protein product [Periconia digitata]